MKVLLVTIAIISALCVHCAVAEEHETNYESPAVVTEVSGDVVTFDTPDGNIWCMYGHGYALGESVTVTFSDAGTPDYIYDDIVLDAVESRGVRA